MIFNKDSIKNENDYNQHVYFDRDTPRDFPTTPIGSTPVQGNNNMLFGDYIAH